MNRAERSEPEPAENRFRYNRLRHMSQGVPVAKASRRPADIRCKCDHKMGYHAEFIGRRIRAWFGEVPLVPQGGNTGSLAGGVPHGEVLRSLPRMNKIREIDAADYTMTVDPRRLCSVVCRSDEGDKQTARPRISGQARIRRRRLALRRRQVPI